MCDKKHHRQTLRVFTEYPFLIVFDFGMLTVRQEYNIAQFISDNNERKK